MKRLRSLLFVAFSCSLLGLGSCAHPDPYVQRGRTQGTVIGGAAGGIIGNNSKIGTAGGIAIGSVLGGILGDTAGKKNSMYYNRAPQNPQYNFGGRGW